MNDNAHTEIDKRPVGACEPDREGGRGGGNEYENMHAHQVRRGSRRKKEVAILGAEGAFPGADSAAVTLRSSAFGSH